MSSPSSGVETRRSGAPPPPPYDTVTVRLTSRDRELLLNLRDQGAALAEDLRRWFPSSVALRVRILRLVRSGSVEVVGHCRGQRIFGLGPAGKRHLRIRSNWRTRPQEALRQVIWRRCHARLVGEGYRKIGPWHGKLVLYRKSSGPALAVQVFATGPSVRHLRALLKGHRPALIRDGVVLCVFSPQAWALQKFAACSSSILLRTLPQDACSPMTPRENRIRRYTSSTSGGQSTLAAT